MSGDTWAQQHGEVSAELVARAGSDPAAFGDLYDHYLPRVYAFCRKYVQTREEAEDLTALTFAHALAAIARYEERDIPFSRWLLRIAANAVIDHARRRGHRSVSDLELERIGDEGHLEQWEQAYWLQTHVDALPDDQQEVVRLRFYEDLRFQDIAVQMGRSEGAVKQLLRRALKALHLRIQEETEEGSADD